MDIIFHNLRKLEYDADIPIYLLEILRSDYTYKSIIVEMLPKIVETFHDPHLCIPLLYEFLLDQDRKILYNFIIKEKHMHNTLFNELITSNHYQHRLALAEILQRKGIVEKDMKYVKSLLEDEIEVVCKFAVSLVDKQFGNQNILNLIDKLYNGSYYLQGVCSSLLKYLESGDELNKLTNKLLNCETWLVRYNLCRVLYSLNIDEELLDKCCKKMVSDNVEEIRMLFAKVVCSSFRNDKMKLKYIKKLSCDESSHVRLELVGELNALMSRNDDPLIHKFIIDILKNMIYHNEIEIKLLACEIICRYMLKTFNKETPSDILKSINELKYENNLISSYNNIEDFQFLFDYFKVFGENNKWRSRIRLLNMIIDIGSEDMYFFDKKLKTFLFSLLRDKVEIIRHSAGMAFVGLVNKFGVDFLVMNYDELLELVNSEKYMLRVISLEILSKIVALKNIGTDIYCKYILPLLHILQNDPVNNLREYYDEVIRDADIYNDKLKELV